MIDKYLIIINYTIVLIVLLSIIIILRKHFTKKEICPFCSNKNDLERVKKPFIFDIIPFLKIIKVICYKCHHKHYRLIK
jgi:hypothetical protein